MSVEHHDFPYFFLPDPWPVISVVKMFFLLRGVFNIFNSLLTSLISFTKFILNCILYIFTCNILVCLTTFICYSHHSIGIPLVVRWRSKRTMTLMTSGDSNACLRHALIFAQLFWREKHNEYTTLIIAQFLDCKALTFCEWNNGIVCFSYPFPVFKLTMFNGRWTLLQNVFI
jgi:hypothetical protein